MGFFDWHKRQTEWWKKKLNISDYVLAWIGFFKGLVFGLIVYFNQQVTQALEMGKQGMSRQEILARFPTFVQQMPSHPRNPYGQKM